jgi:hypothetical protein
VTVSSFSVAPETHLVSGTAPADEPTPHDTSRQENTAVTVYVDNYRCPTTIGRLNGRWSHLTADTPEELQKFATGLGLRRAWFQARCRYATCPAPAGVCVHFHYDVVDTVRTRAIYAGAVPIDVRDFGQLIRIRRLAQARMAEVAR